MNKEYVVPALEKAHSILMLIASKGNELKLTDIVSALKYNKSTVFSLLTSMEQFKWVIKNSNSTYSIGSTLGRWGAEFFRNFNIKDFFDEEAIELAKEIQQTIQLSVLNGKDIIYLSKQSGNPAFEILTYPGLRIPAYATAMGKVLLTKFTEQELVNLYGDNLEPLTIATVKTVNDLCKQIQFYNKNGYIVEREETILGFVCFAVPIFDDKHEIIAAMSTTLTVSETTDKIDLEFIIAKLKETSNKITLKLSSHI